MTYTEETFNQNLAYAEKLLQEQIQKESAPKLFKEMSLLMGENIKERENYQAEWGTFETDRDIYEKLNPGDLYELEREDQLKEANEHLETIALRLVEGFTKIGQQMPNMTSTTLKKINLLHFAYKETKDDLLLKSFMDAYGTLPLKTEEQLCMVDRFLETPHIQQQRRRVLKCIDKALDDAAPEASSSVSLTKKAMRFISKIDERTQGKDGQLLIMMLKKMSTLNPALSEKTQPMIKKLDGKENLSLTLSSCAETNDYKTSNGQTVNIISGKGCPTVRISSDGNTYFLGDNRSHSKNSPFVKKRSCKPNGR